MNRHSFYFIVLLVMCPLTSHAFSCEPGPLFQLGDQATYRFTESNATPVTITAIAVQQTNIEMVFSIQEGVASYLVSFPVGCFGLLGEQESDLVAPVYTDFYRVVEILDPDPWVFGASDPAAHINRVSNSCAGGSEVNLFLCQTRYAPSAENGVIDVETTLREDFIDDPINRLQSKIQRYDDGRIDTIERIANNDTNPDSAPATPEGLRALVYSHTSAEVFWSRADSDTRIVAYEVQRGGDVLGVVNGTSFFDDQREPDLEYLYSVTAIDADGRRSDAATIIANAFGGNIPSVATTTPTNLPAVQGFRAEIYSENAGELFWNRLDINVPVRYEIARNDQVLGEFDATSFFDADLQPGVRYDYTIVAVGPANIRSNAAFVTLITPGLASAQPIESDLAFAVEHVVYSGTALELFWPAFERTDSTGFRYDVYRDGDLVGVVDGKSYFTEGLVAGQTYSFQIFVFDSRNEPVASSQPVLITSGS